MGGGWCFEGSLPWGVSRDVVAVLGIGVWLGLGAMRLWECAQSWGWSRRDGGRGCGVNCHIWQLPVDLRLFCSLRAELALFFVLQEELSSLNTVGRRWGQNGGCVA